MEKILHGTPASVGKAQGKVKIILERKDWMTFEKGDILVTRITDPTMVPLMGKAAGIVCDIGGMMSHPAIIARELGIPCIVGTQDATQILKQNQLIEMNGSTGEVFLVNK